MRKPMLVLLALAISLFGTQCWAATKTSRSPAVLPAAPLEFSPCGSEEQPPCSIPNSFTPGPDGTTRGVYDFGVNGLLIVDFVKVVRPFTLTVTTQFTTAPTLDPDVFPNTTCFHYPSSSICTQYDFIGNVPGRVNGLPKKGHEYQGNINLELSYSSRDSAQDPAFGHAPRESTIFSEDILTSYSPLCDIRVGCGGDGTMDGTTPGLSSVNALNKRLKDTDDCFMFVSPQPPLLTFAVGQEIEVAFRLFDNTTCTGDPLRDKDARVSLSTIDGNGHVVFLRLRNKEEGNKFHFDDEDGVNELDLSTEGLAPGKYTITVSSDEFATQSVNITLTPETDSDHPE